MKIYNQADFRWDIMVGWHNHFIFLVPSPLLSSLWTDFFNSGKDSCSFQSSCQYELTLASKRTCSVRWSLILECAIDRFSLWWIAACCFALSCVDGCAAVLLACVYALMCWTSLKWPVGSGWQGTVRADKWWSGVTEVGLVLTLELDWMDPAPGLVVGEDQSAGRGKTL